MRLLVRVNGQPAMIIGYGPGENGQPKAIIVIDGGLAAVNLSEIELLSIPNKLRKLRKRLDKAKREAETELESQT